MLRTTESKNGSLVDQLKAVLKDAIDYAVSQLAYLQARITELALSSLVFAVLIVAAGILGLAAFVLINVALGFWLTHLTGHAGWSLLILGVAYIVVGGICAGVALRWLKQLRS